MTKHSSTTTTASSSSSTTRLRAVALMALVMTLLIGLLRVVTSVQSVSTTLQQGTESTSTFVAKGSNSTNDENSEATLPATRPPELDILMGLSGDAGGFFLEIQILLKSILLNAPIDAHLTIHMMADRPAFVKLQTETFAKTSGNSTNNNNNNNNNNTNKQQKRHNLMATHLHLWKSRNPIAIRVYDISLLAQDWKRKIQNLYKNHTKGKFQHAVTLHTLGTWFRLMADEVLPETVEQVIYMDTDVVILSNLQALLLLPPPTTTFNQIETNETVSQEQQEEWFAMDEGGNAGFIRVHIRKLPEMWKAVQEAGVENFEYTHQNADQLFLRILRIRHPQHVGVLPKPYDAALADGLWRHKKNLEVKRPEIGMIHYSGGGSSKEAWFGAGLDNVNSFWVTGKNDRGYIKETERTFGSGGYYIRLPWTWARHFAASVIPPGEQGYNLTIEYKHVLPANHTT